MLLLVVLGETFIRGKDISGNSKLMIRGIKGPEVGSKDHNAECNVHIIVVLLHTFLKLIGQVLAKTHIWGVWDVNFT